MNKFAKRLMTGVLAGALATSMALPAFAADGDLLQKAEDAITVTGLKSGDTATAYKFIEYNSTNGQWKMVKDIAKTTGGNYTVNDLLEIDSSEAADIAKATSGLTATSMMVTNGTATATGVAAGAYVIIIQSGSTGDKDYIYNPVFVSADYIEGGNTIGLPANYGSESVAKQNEIKVEKTAGTNEDNQATVKVGDTIPFTIKTTIPAYTGAYTTPYFAIKDSLSDGLEITGNVTVIGVGEGTYKTPTINNDKKGLTVEFTENYLKSMTAPVEVTVTYNAKVTTSAFTNVNQETNAANIEYSNNPSDASSHGKRYDKTNHYTFSLDADLLGTSDSEYVTSEFVKVGVNQDGTPVIAENEQTEKANGTKVSALDGATFALYTDKDCTQAYKDSANNNVTATTENGGLLHINGLDEGTYYLKETAAPTGYVVNDTPIKVVISATYKSETVTEKIDNVNYTYDVNILTGYTVAFSDIGEGKGTTATSTYTFTNNGPTITVQKDNDGHAGDVSALFNNVKANGLPTTGGMGTTIFYIAGIVLVGGAAILLVTRRRMSAR